jgi:hypothetical protein
MGWTGYTHKPHDIRQEMARIVLPWIPVQISQVGSTWYIAAQHNDIITCFVILTRSDRGQWLYKDMDESMGPVEAKAPKSLIKRLSPTDHPHALEWRQRCLDYASRPRYKPGDKIVLSDPVHFKGHPPQTEFTRTDKYWHNAAIGLCRLSPYNLQGATRA